MNKKNVPAKVMMPPAPEVITVPKDTDEVACDGGHPSLGHPIVWYRFDEGADRLTCGYCDREFVRG